MTLVDVSLLEASALNVMDVTDGQERCGIHVGDDGLQLGLLQTSDDDEDDFFVSACEAALPVEVCNTAAKTAHYGLANLAIFVTDDPRRLGLVEALDDDIDHLEGNIVGDQGIHRAIPAEYKACAGQNEQVGEHNNLAH